MVVEEERNKMPVREKNLKVELPVVADSSLDRQFAKAKLNAFPTSKRWLMPLLYKEVRKGGGNPGLGFVAKHCRSSK